MVTKVLFFDTSALLKLFINEDGTQKIKWLCAAETKVLHNLHFVINEQVIKEFVNKVDSFIDKNQISYPKGELIKSQFLQFHNGKVFRVIGQGIVSNTKIETTFAEIIHELSLTENKDDWDGYHYQSIANALAYLGGESNPILVTADKMFANKVAQKGYKVINPLKQSKSEIENIIA